MKYVFGPERERSMRREEAKSANITIVFCVLFALIAGVILIGLLINIPHTTIVENKEARYLYENGVEVDAYLKSFYKSRSTFNYSHGNYVLVFEYVDSTGNAFKDDCDDNIYCDGPEEWSIREQEIEQMISNSYTKKMLIADNGKCILSDKKETLKSNTSTIIYIAVIVGATIVLGLSIFGIIKQAKKIKVIKSYKN